MATEDTDIERLAMWLHASATTLGQTEIVRRILRHAMEQSMSAEGQLEDNELDYREEETPSLLTRFTAHWDECERMQSDN